LPSPFLKRRSAAVAPILNPIRTKRERQFFIDWEHLHLDFQGLVEDAVGSRKSKTALAAATGFETGLFAFVPDPYVKGVAVLAGSVTSALGAKARREQSGDENALHAYLAAGKPLLWRDYEASYAEKMPARADFKSFLIPVRTTKREGVRTPLGVILSEVELPEDRNVLSGSGLLLRGKLVNRIRLPKEVLEKLKRGSAKP